MASAIAVKAYEAAESLLADNRSKLVFGGKVRPNWIEEGARFWYTVDAPSGRRFILIDPQTGTREEAFDHEKLASMLSAVSGSEVDSSRLPIGAIELTDESVEFSAFGAQWRCALDSYECTRIEDYVPRVPLEVPSPDGKLAVFRRDYDLWVRSLETGEEWALTGDGIVDYSYGTNVDSAESTALFKNLGLPHTPPVVVWSADSTRIITHRTDQRGVAVMPLIDIAPSDGGRPQLIERRYPLPGDEVVPRAELMVFDVASGTSVTAQAPPLLMPYLSPLVFGCVWWAEQGSAVYYLDSPRDQHTLQLCRLDPATGEVSLVLQERGETRIESRQQVIQRPIVRVLSDGSQVLWYSQRDGWGHLYLYDVASGELITQLTSGDWAVQEILHVDEDARTAYFMASGLIDADPYRRSVCRVDLDGTGFARVTEDDLDHVVRVPDLGKYFIDSASTVDSAPVITVKDWTGRVLVDLERADISRLEATGWRPPERFCVTAADGVTQLYGVLHRPHDFDPNKRYPVIDHPYPGPQVYRVQPSFDPGFYGYDAEAVAALGFVVMAVDGRGTPGRSKAFHDESYGKLGDAGCLEDHVAALRELAESRPWMDLQRVGIFGRSGGGFATVRAMCQFPELYKVGVSECGNHEQRIYHLLWSESYDGPFDEQVAARSSNVELAEKLEGKLLLVHGGSDDNVTPYHTLRLVERLIAADKDFDMLIVPGAEHRFFGYEHHVARRRWDYFVRHLLQLEPPTGFRIRPVHLDLEQLGELIDG